MVTAPRAIANPQPGFFQLRLVKLGPFVPARIARTCVCTVNGGDAQAEHDWRPTCDRFPPLEATINGEPADLYRVWLGGRAITKAEFDFLTADTAHARQFRPDSPRANPRTPIDLNRLPPLF